MTVASPPPRLTWIEHAIGAAKTLLHLSGVGLVVAFAVGLLWVASAVRDWLHQPPPAAPVVLQPTPQTANTPVVVQPATVGIMQLSAKDRQWIAQHTGIPAAQIVSATPTQPGQAAPLASDTVKPAPNGGTVTATLDSTGKVTETFVAAPYGLFAWGEHTDIGIFDSVAGSQKGAGLFVAQDLFSVGGQKFRLNFGARAFDTLTGSHVNRGVEITSALRIR